MGKLLNPSESHSVSSSVMCKLHHGSVSGATNYSRFVDNLPTNYSAT